MNETEPLGVDVLEGVKGEAVEVQRDKVVRGLVREVRRLRFRLAAIKRLIEEVA